MTAARIILWRHGRTEWNVVDRFQGQADIPIDAVGQCPGDPSGGSACRLPASRVVLQRLVPGYQTAEVLAERTELEIVTDKRLREIQVGSWEGLLGEEIRSADPELARRLWAGEDVRRSPTGESPSEVAERMVEALMEIAESAADDSTVVVVTHGLSGRVGACRFVGLPFPQWRLFGGLSNCAWVSIDRHRSGAYWRIEGYNLTANSDLEVD